jgi:hypothetical protein
VSIQHVTYVLERSQAKNGDRLVLLSLANHADERDECWPSHACIAHESGLSVDQVKRCLRQLEKDGRVVRVVNAAPDDRIPRDRRPNLYRLTMTIEKPSWRQVRDGGADTSPPRGGGSRADGGADHARTGGRERHPEPSEEPSEEAGARKKRATAISASFAVDESMRTWAAEKAPEVDLTAETEKFVDYWLGRGKAMKDWAATWRNWIRRAAQDLDARRAQEAPREGRAQAAAVEVERNRRRASGEACPECGDVGFVLEGNTAVPCRCRTAAAS